jgi:AmmeMemoRadiSam system protein A
MYQPKTIYTQVAMDAITTWLRQGNARTLEKKTPPSELADVRRACFVSLHKTSGELRGCIGSIEPHETNLYREIIQNAINAAFHDSRFTPLTEEELVDIELSVDVLTTPEMISDESELDPQIYGVIVSDGAFNRGVLLPAIKTIDSVEEQLRLVKRKAGLSGYDNESLKFYRFTSTRYG